MKREQTIADINTAKYPQPPTWLEIDAFLKEISMNMYQFERYYGLPFNQLTQIKSGAKRLAPQYWHFVFQKIKPDFGAGFLDEYTKKRQKNRIKTRLPLNLPPLSEESSITHDRLKTVA